MKKTLIALALVSLPVAASAEVILYGQIKAGAEYSEAKAGADARHNLYLQDFGSRIGFKGSEDLGNGLKAIWQFEQGIHIGQGSWQANQQGQGRTSFIGLEGGLGRVTAGRVDNPIDANVSGTDQWEYAPTTATSPANSSGVLGLERYSRFSRRNVSVNYYSPDMNGFDFHVQVAPGTDRYGASPSVNNNKFTVFGLGLGYKSNAGIFARYAGEYGKDSHNQAKAYQVHNVTVGYDANNLNAQVGFQYGRNVAASGLLNGDTYVTVGGANNEVNTKEVAASVAYTAGAVTPKLSVAYGRANNDAKTRYTQAIIGADYAFSRRTTGLVSVGWLKEGDRQATDSTWALGTGIVHKF